MRVFEQRAGGASGEAASVAVTEVAVNGVLYVILLVVLSGHWWRW